MHSREPRKPMNCCLVCEDSRSVFGSDRLAAGGQPVMEVQASIAFLAMSRQHYREEDGWRSSE